MAQQKILVSECDNCGAVDRMPLPDSNKKAELILPKGWMIITGKTATTDVFEIITCARCTINVRNAAGKGIK